MTSRTERCVCGGKITAPSMHAAPQFVLAHNQTALHQAWRAWNTWRDLAIDPRRERPTAGQSPRDVSEKAVRASAATAGGRS